MEQLFGLSHRNDIEQLLVIRSVDSSSSTDDKDLPSEIQAVSLSLILYSVNQRGCLQDALVIMSFH